MQFNAIRNNASKKVISALIARATVAFSGVILTLTLPKYFSIEDVGLVYFTITQAAFLATIFKLGLDYTVNPLTKKDSSNENVNTLVSSGFFLILLSSIIFGTIYYFVINESDLFNIEIKNRIWYLSLWLWATAFALNLFAFQFFRLQGKVILASFTRGMFSNLAIIVSLLILIIFISNVNVYLATLVFSMSILLISIINIAINLKFGHVKFRNVRNLLNKTPKFLLYSLMIVLSMDMDYWVISAMLQTEDLAIYSTMKRLALLCAICIDLANLVIPGLYLEYKNEAKIAQLMKRMSFFFTLASLSVFLITLIFGEYIIILLFGHAYAEGYLVLNILMFSFCVSIACGFSEIFLILNDQKNILINVMCISLIISLIANIMLVDVYGIIGAAISFLISTLVVRLSLTMFILKKYKLNLMANWK